MPYTPTSPVAATLAAIVPMAAALSDVRTMLRVNTTENALKRMCPGDAGFVIGQAGAWDGTRMNPAAAPAIIWEAQSPEYEMRTQNGWTVTHQIDVHLLHKREPNDTDVDAYLRAWDEHNLIQKALRAQSPNSLVLQGVFTATAPAVFGPEAPPVLQGGYISTLAIRYTKGQP